MKVASPVGLTLRMALVSDLKNLMKHWLAWKTRPVVQPQTTRTLITRLRLLMLISQWPGGLLGGKRE